MSLIDIALKNLRRRKGRAAFALAGLSIAVATVVTLLTLFGSVSHGILHKMERYGANILIVPRTDTLSLTYAGLDLGGVSYQRQEIRQDDLALIRSIPNADKLAAVGPVVLGPLRVGEREILLAGLDIGTAPLLKPWWSVTGRLPGPGEVLLGSAAGEALGLAPGAVIEAGERRIPVTGVLAETGSQDDQLLITDIATAQALLGAPGAVTMVEVAAHCADCPIELLMAEISQVLPNARVTAIRQVVEGRMDAMRHFQGFLYGVGAVVVLVGCLVVLVTMMGSVRERTAEIGIFRAIGFRRSAVMTVILGEAAILSALAGALGYLGGIGLTRLLLPFFLEGQQATLHLDPVVPVAAMGLSLVLGVLSGLVPAVQASRLDPNAALRAL